MSDYAEPHLQAARDHQHGDVGRRKDIDVPPGEVFPGHCFENNLPMVITSIIRKPNDGISKSTTHQDGRAFDLRLNNWNIGQIIKLEEYLKESCFDLGAISKETGEPRVIHVHGDGNWLHAHMQVRRTDVHPSRTTKAPTS